MTTHLKPRSATITLYQGDDMDQLAQLQRTVDIAERQLNDRERETAAAADTARAGDDTSDEIAAAQAAVGAARDAFDTFVDDAAGRALSVVLHTIGEEWFWVLVDEHPPRLVAKKVPAPAEGEAPAEPEMVEHEDDAAWGVNIRTFPAALLTFRRLDDEGDEPEMVCTIAEPEFTSDAKVRRFVRRELAAGDFDVLWQTIYLLNRTGTQDPKGLTYSPTDSRSTDET